MAGEGRTRRNGARNAANGATNEAERGGAADADGAVNHGRVIAAGCANRQVRTTTRDRHCRLAARRRDCPAVYGQRRSRAQRDRRVALNLAARHFSRHSSSRRINCLLGGSYLATLYAKPCVVAANSHEKQPVVAIRRPHEDAISARRVANRQRSLYGKAPTLRPLANRKRVPVEVEDNVLALIDCFSALELIVINQRYRRSSSVSRHSADCLFERLVLVFANLGHLALGERGSRREAEGDHERRREHRETDPPSLLHRWYPSSTASGHSLLLDKKPASK